MSLEFKDKFHGGDVILRTILGKGLRLDEATRERKGKKGKESTANILL